jgi:GNAT superfamily N-acetyltransferase
MSQAGISITVTRTYLQLTAREQAEAGTVSKPGVRVKQIRDCPGWFYRFLYAEVGRFYHWTDRLPWSDEQIQAHLSRPQISLWVMYTDGEPAGYFELESHDDGSTEIAYFGLLPESIGMGLGKYLLSTAIDRAWSGGANRVWLHTCTLDDPAALPNYLNRGFKPFKEEQYVTTVSEAELQQGKWRKDS